PLPVALAGSVPLYFYTRRIGPALEQARAEVVYIEEEPYSMAALQWARLARRRRVPAAFYTAQNIGRTYPLPVRWAERSVWRASSGATAVSEAAAGALRSRGYTGAVGIVPLSVDVGVFAPGLAESPTRESLGLRGQVIGYLG